jgi:acyl carrier protein
MNKQDLFNLISNAIGIDIDGITLDSDFHGDFNCEEREMIELKLQLEDVLKIKIEEEDFEKVETVNDLVEIVEENSDELID